MLFSKPVSVVLVVLVTALDLVVTLWCQPESYWQDHYSCQEGNPIGRAILCKGPNYWAVSSCLWVLLVLWAVIRLPNRVSTLAVIIVLLGHGWGLSTWMAQVFPNFQVYECLFYVALCILMALVSKHWLNKKPSTR